MRKLYYLFFLLMLCACEQEQLEPDIKEESKDIKNKKEKADNNKSSNNPFYKATLQVFSSNPVELMEPIYLDLTLEMNSTYPGDPNDIQSLGYQIVRNGEPFDENDGDTYLSCGVFATRCTIDAKQPGEWKIRAVVYYDNETYGWQTVYSNEEEIEIIFPDITEISADGGIQSSMTSAWSQTKQAASSSGRREMGFRIFANTESDNLQYETNLIQLGPVVNCLENGEMTLTGNSTYSSYFENGGKFYVASFHTHTPQFYCHCSPCRGTGPSGPDYSWDMPGLVYDYYGPIYAYYPLNSSAKVYDYGPSRRLRPFNY